MDTQIGLISEPKAGYKTTEFWLTLLVTSLGALMASGLFNEDSQVFKLVGVALAALSQFGYSVGRIKVKNAANKVTDNKLPYNVLDRLVDRVLEYKQAENNNRNYSDPKWDAGATD